MSISAAEEANIIAQNGSTILPTGTASLVTQPFAQTYDRRLAISAAVAPTSGTLTMTAIWLPAGKTVTGITFVSGATGETGGTHLYYALYDRNLNLLAQATDNTGATAFGANTAFRMALSSPYNLTYTGLYYLGFMCTQSAGTIPTLLNITSGVTNNNGSITGMTPIVAATSSTGLSSGTAPNPAGALTAIVNAYYAFVD
jgi:hypothetical protein